MTEIAVPLDVAQKVYDTAINSLDWGSGFLDDEEVAALRHFAEVIGADPWEATPFNFRPKYCPGHTWTEWKRSAYYNNVENRRCTTCQKQESRS